LPSPVQLIRFLARAAAPAALLLGAPLLLAQASQSSMPLDSGFGPMDATPPSEPVAQIIQEMTAKETLFDQALNDYTWTRSTKVQTLDDDGHPNGQYYEVVDIYYNAQNERMERVTDAPMGKLLDTSGSGEIMMSEKDFSDIEHRLPFVLTSQDASQYDITYLGKQNVDEVATYVFDVKPKVLEKNKRYFQGHIWVDQKDHQIVVTNGKNVPDDLRPGHEDLTIPFVTYRQLVDGKYWFPVYTVGEAVLHFSGGHGYLSQNAHMREMLKYTNYHQFRTSVRILFNGQEIPNNAPKQAQPPAKAPPAQQPPATPPQ
jgi:hypothetical protein